MRRKNFITCGARELDVFIDKIYFKGISKGIELNEIINTLYKNNGTLCFPKSSGLGFSETENCLGKHTLVSI